MVDVPDRDTATRQPSHRDIIQRAGGPAAFGHQIKVSPNNVKAWKRLDSIPGPYFRQIAEAGLATLEELAAAAAARRTGEAEQVTA